MSSHSSLHKQCVDFAHSHIETRLMCPECVRTIRGYKNHVKVYKTISGLWRHFKIEHGQIKNSKFDTDDIRLVLKGLARALEWGMFP